MLNIEPDVIQVAVGVIIRPSGEILIALRSSDKHLGNVWEFPGGKVEPGESVEKALARELYEELHITVHASRPLLNIRHKYPEMSVHLNVREICAFSGEAYGREGQTIRWVRPDELVDFEFPAANKPILNALLLPRTIAVTGRFSSAEDFRYRLERAIERGAEGVYLRLGTRGIDQKSLCRIAESICCKYSTTVFTNRELLQYFEGSVGLHLRSHELFQEGLDIPRPPKWVGASCHDLEEIARAVNIRVNYIFASPILQTSSHEGAIPIGFEKFRSWIEATPVPIYGLGGLTLDDLPGVKALGGQGIAAIRGFWE